MTDNQTPPDWVLIEAAKRCGWDGFALSHLQAEYDDIEEGEVFRALCDMIERYEQPPVDRKLLCAREALEQCGWVHNPDREETCVRAIELWESGYGK